MSLIINTNTSSIIAQKSLKGSTTKLNLAVERMTTGCKINHAKDNAANYSISTNMTTKMNAYLVAQDNVAMGMDMIATAEGIVSQIEDKLKRLRELQTQALNGTYGNTSLKAINTEAMALTKEIERLYDTAEFNGLNLFSSKKVNNFARSVQPQTFSLLARNAVMPIDAQDAAPSIDSAGFIKEIAQRDTDLMTKLAEVSVNTEITTGTYSISTVSELKQLAVMANNDKISGGEFVLANDLDLSECTSWTLIGSTLVDDSYMRNIIFDGNGYVIRNFSPETDTESLFGIIENSTIKNLGLEDAYLFNNISGHGCSALVYGLYNSTLSNCYATGQITSNVSDTYIGGLFSVVVGYGDIQDCWTDVDISGGLGAGGIGSLTMYGSANINNCYSFGDISSKTAAGIIFQQTEFDPDGSTYGIATKVTNAYSFGKLAGTMNTVGILYSPSEIYADSVANCYYNSELNPGVDGLISNSTNNAPASAAVGKTNTELMTMIPALHSYSQPNINGSNIVSLQVGISSDESSQIFIDTKFNLNGIKDFYNIGLDLSTNYLSKIDKMLEIISEKQTHFGSVINRLESVLDEIEIHYNNLASSRSTIHDTDIAEVSSEYIKMQILQQASSTLLAAANQTPSIALQLI